MIGWSIFFFCVLLLYLTRQKPKVKRKQALAKSTVLNTQKRQSKAKIIIERSGKDGQDDDLSVLEPSLTKHEDTPIVYSTITFTPIKAEPPERDVKVTGQPHLVKKGFPDNQVPEQPAKDTYDQVVSLIEPVMKMPHWNHSYIYSREELRSAKPEQKKFYDYYKRCFLKGELIEVGDNTNYGFILYFDLIHEYKTHLDLRLLERQFGLLDRSCPKTHAYGQSFLVAKMREFGDEKGLARLGYVEHWRTRYEKQLKLSKSEQKLYDAIYLSSNSFINIEQCGLETLRLYIRSISILEVQYKLAGTAIDDSFYTILDLIARKENRYRLNSPNYKYTVEQSNQVYLIILRYCENQLRDIYGHKRKINLFNDYRHKEVIEAINDQLIRYLESGKRELIKDVPAPIDATIIALNSVNITRWKDHIELTEANFTGLGKSIFLQQAEQVILENRDNPSKEIIFLELSKFLAPFDKIACLQYHLRYVLQNALAKRLVLKPVSKLVQKSVFETATQYQQFEAIVEKLGKTIDLDTAMVGLSAIYTPVRKKMLLDTEAIRQVVAEHTETVEVLNEYLKDEEDVLQAQTVPLLINMGSMEAERIEKNKTKKTETEKMDIPVYKQEVLVSLNQTELQLLELFRFNNLQLSAIAINNFCRDNGVMKGAVIDSINEKLYELNDDVLIEETVNGEYTISSEYFQILRF